MATPIEDPSYETSALGSPSVGLPIAQEGDRNLHPLRPDPERDSRPFHPFNQVSKGRLSFGGARGRASLLPGGDYRIRTDDPLLAKQVLYQLS
jgi:hypothetical protein